MVGQASSFLGPSVPTCQDSLDPALLTSGLVLSAPDVDDFAGFSQDVDMMGVFARAGSWSNAFAVYRTGANVVGPDGQAVPVSSLASPLASFGASLSSSKSATAMAALATSNPVFSAHVAYWNMSTFGADIVDNAIRGVNAFSGKPLPMRAAVAVAGTLAHVEWMYFFSLVFDGVRQCAASTPVSPLDETQRSWQLDRAIALFYGASTDSVGLGASQTGSLAGLVTTWCVRFSTCTSSASRLGATGATATDGTTAAALGGVQALVRSLDCQTARAFTATRVLRSLTVPLVQGVLYNLVLADPAVPCTNCTEQRSKEWGELWTFASALLPMVQQCDASVARMLRANAEIVPGNGVKPVKDGYRAVTSALQSTFVCLGISCADVGSAFPTTQPACDDAKLMGNNNNGCAASGVGLDGMAAPISVGGAVGVSIAVILIVTACNCVCYRLGKRKGQGQHEFGMDGGPTGGPNPSPVGGGGAAFEMTPPVGSVTAAALRATASGRARTVNAPPPSSPFSDNEAEVGAAPGTSVRGKDGESILVV